MQDRGPVHRVDHVAGQEPAKPASCSEGEEVGGSRMGGRKVRDAPCAVARPVGLDRLDDEQARAHLYTGGRIRGGQTARARGHALRALS